MKFVKLIGLLLLISSHQVFGYGSSSSAKACAKPQLSDFQPVNNSTVAPKSTFSFVASANTNPKSISVTVKQQAVSVTVTPIAQGFRVSGQLPNVTGAARININAESANACKANEGWLVTIAEH